MKYAIRILCWYNPVIRDDSLQVITRPVNKILILHPENFWLQAFVINLSKVMTLSSYHILPMSWQTFFFSQSLSQYQNPFPWNSITKTLQQGSSTCEQPITDCKRWRCAKVSPMKKTVELNWNLHLYTSFPFLTLSYIVEKCL